MRSRNRLWTYAAILVSIVVGGVIVNFLIDLLEGNLSIRLAAGMFVLVTLATAVVLYYRVRSPDQ